jgi:hypothetical protein
MYWQPIETAPKTGEEILVTDGGFIIQAMWDEVDYSEFYGKYYYAWNYDPAQIDTSDFAPKYWAKLPPMPKQEHLHQD